MQTGGGGFVLKGGGGGGKAMKIGNAGDKLRHELKESGNMEELELGLSEDVSNLSLYKRIVAWAAKKKPFQKDIRTIQAKFGSAPASYFIFYRFIFLQVCLIAFVGAVFIVLHLALLAGEDGRTFSELMTSKGFLPGFMLFSTFSRYEAFQYSTFIIFGLLVFSVSIGEHLIAEDKSMKRIDKQEEGNEAPYSKIALCAWDFGSAGYFPTARQVDEQLASQSLTLMVQWEETRTAGLMKSRSRYELLVLYSRRFAALIAYLAVQAGSFTAIVLVTINTDAITQWLSTTPFSNFASILAPLSLNVLNTLAPPILKLITLQEKWDSGQMQLNVLLFRMYFSNILNTLILGLSYLMLADPFLFAQFSTVRQSLQLAESGVFDCRIDQAADAMFSLIVTNFFIGNIQMVVMGYVYRFLYSKIFECLGKDFEPFPFEVEPAMINLFNNMSLVMITFPFAPQAMVFLPISIYISVKVEVFAICTFNGKPERTWKAHQSGVIFTSFYLLTLVLIGLPTAVYFLSCTSFPKDCLIQDWDIGLCNAEMDYNNICEKDPTDKYYPFYSNINYPKDICSKSCGPFVDYEYNMLPFKQVLTSFSLLDFIWGLFFNSSYVTWIVILVLIVNGYRTRNTRETQRESDEAKERSMSIQIEALEAEKKRQDKLIARMKLQAAAEEEAQNINTSRFDS